MIINYDKQNGFTSFLDNFTKNTKEYLITDEIKNTFDKLNGVDLSNVKDFDALAKSLGITNTEVINFAKNTPAAEVSLDNFKSKMESSTKSASSFGSALKSIGGNLLSFGINAGVMLAATLAIQAISKAVDEATLSLEEADEATEQMMSSFQSAKSEADSNAKAVADLKDEYASLMKGVSQYNNLNISLSTEDYERYLELTNQIAEMYPDLVKGYDAQGNAILNLQGNIQNLTKATEEAQRAAYALAFTGSKDIENSGFDAIAKSYLADTSDTGKWYDNFWKKLTHRVTATQEAGIDIDYKGAIKELEDFQKSTADEIWRDRNSNNTFVADLLGIDNDTLLMATEEELEQFKNQAQTIINSYQQIMDEALGNVQMAAEGYLKGIENASGTLQSGYDLLNENQQGLVSILVSNMSQEDADIIMSNDNAELAMRNYVDNLVNIIKYGGSDVEDAYTGLNDILADGDNLTSDSLSKIETYISQLSQATGTSEKSLKTIFGIDYLWDTERTFKNNIKQLSKTSKEQEKLSDYTKDFNNEQKQAWLTATNGCLNAQSAIQSYEEAMLNASSAASDGVYNVIDAISEADSAFAKAKDSLETENMGATYDSMLEMAETAKKLAETGDIGTDDFKSIAAMFSPTGADDLANWEENLSKINRYFTKDSNDGLLNFLNDLESHDFAQYNKETQEWSYSINDLEQAAKALGIGFEPFMAIFGKLDDKGFHNDFFADEADGMAHLTDLTNQLVEAEGELYDLEKNDPGNSTAIEAKKQEIEELKGRIESTTDSLDKLLNKSVEDRKAEDEKNRTGLQSAIEQFNANSGNLSAVGQKQWANEIISTGAEKGYTIYYGVDGKLYLDTTEAEQKIDEIRDGFIKDPISSTFDLKMSDQIELANSAVQSLKELGKTDIDFQFGTGDFNVIKAEIKSAQHILDEFKNDDGTINVDVKGAQEAQVLLAQLLREEAKLNEPAVMSVDTSALSNDAQTAISDIQTLISAVEERDIAIAVGADPSDAEKIISDTLINLQANSDILSKIGVDTTDLDSAMSSIAKLDPETIVNILANTTNYNRVVDTATQPGTKNISLNVSNESSFRAKMASLTATEVKNVVVQMHGGSSRSGYENAIHADGTFHAHANGTVMPAHASGTNVAIDHDQEAIINEIGEEGLIRNGIFTRIKGGLQKIKLKVGDIILNHKQVEELDKNGYVTSNGGHGKLIGSFFQGTIGRLRAFAGGSGAGGSGGGSLKTSSSSSTKKKSSSSSSGSSSKSSSDASDTAEEFEEKLNWIEILIDRIERSISSLDLKASSVYKNWSARNSALKSEMSEITNEINVQKQAYNRYLQEANSVGLSESWAKLVRDGKVDISTITDEDLADKIKDYQEWYEKALDCRDAVDELSESLSECYKTAFDNVVTQYDSILSAIEFEKNLLDEYISQTEESGYITSTKYYEALMKTEKDNIAQMQKEKAALLASRDSAVASGAIAKESEAWNEMCQEINDVTLAIEEANTAMIEYSNSIRDIEWQIFDLLQDKISRITTEADFLIDLLSNDKLYDDRGQLTNEGLSTMGLHGVDYNTYMAQADKYAEEMLKIDKELANDPYNQDLIDRKEELLELQQESILAAEDEKQAIKDMVAEGIELELDALDELIQKYKDVINNAKDLYDYNKRISEYTDKIASLEKQLQAYSGDTSEEGRLKIQQITVDLKEARENLEESQYNKFIEDQTKLLDELYEQYELILNERLDNLDALIADMVAEINSSASTISETLSEKAESVGYTLSDNMTSIWDTNSTKISDVITVYGTNFVNALTTTNSTLGTINTNIQSMISQLNAIAKTKTQSASTASASKSSSTSGTASTSTATKTTTTSNTSTTSSNSNVGSFFVYKKDNFDKSRLNKESSIVDRLKWNNYDSSFAQRKSYYSAMGFSGVYTGSSSQNVNMLNWMKKNGFKDGGTIGDLIDRTGESGFILAHTGEEVLSLEKIKTLGDAFAHINPVIDNLNHLLPVLPSNNSVSTSNSSNNIDNVNIEITLPNVTNYPEFKTELQKDKQHIRWLRAETVDLLAGKSSLRGRLM